MDWDQYKRQVDLVALAISHYGYTLVQAKSSRRHVVIRHAHHDDHLVITRGGEEPDRYFNPQDDQDRGTVLDFLLNRENGDWERVRSILEEGALLTQGAPYDQEELPVTELPDFRAMCQALTDPRYLHQRGISAQTLTHAAFQSRVFQRGRLIAFPLFDQEQWVGLDLKGKGFKGYAAGQAKPEVVGFPILMRCQ